MGPECSLPHSQEPVTCPYPEPDRASPYPHTSHLLKIRLNIILPSKAGSPKWSQVSPPKPCIRPSSPLYALHVPPISFFSILTPEQVRSTADYRTDIIKCGNSAMPTCRLVSGFLHTFLKSITFYWPTIALNCIKLKG